MGDKLPRFDRELEPVGGLASPPAQGRELRRLVEVCWISTAASDA